MATQKVLIPTRESHLISNGNHGKLSIIFLNTSFFIFHHRGYARQTGNRISKNSNFHPDIRWILIYIVRIVCNYDNPENTLTEASQILRHASERKENSPCQLNPVMLGKIVNEIWGEKVRLVRRGPRNQQKSFYQNLMKKEDIGPQELLHEVLKEVNEMPLKDGWSKVCEENKVSFIRFESWSFRNQRGFIEVRTEKTLTDLAYFIISHVSFGQANGHTSPGKAPFSRKGEPHFEFYWLFETMPRY